MLGAQSRGVENQRTATIYTILNVFILSRNDTLFDRARTPTDIATRLRYWCRKHFPRSHTGEHTYKSVNVTGEHAESRLLTGGHRAAVVVVKICHHLTAAGRLRGSAKDLASHALLARQRDCLPAQRAGTTGSLRDDADTDGTAVPLRA